MLPCCNVSRQARGVLKCTVEVLDQVTKLTEGALRICHAGLAADPRKRVNPLGFLLEIQEVCPPSKGSGLAELLSVSVKQDIGSRLAALPSGISPERSSARNPVFGDCLGNLLALNASARHILFGSRVVDTSD